jgi:hypothetical protein
MDALVKNSESKSFSGEDIFQLCEGKVRIIEYGELAKAKSLKEVLGKHGAAIILYLTRKGYGHWTAIFRVNKNTVEFFDPYGLVPDEELGFISDNFRRESNQDVPHLTALMAASRDKIIYNQYPLQKLRKSTSTCGRWCGLRIALRKMPLANFVGLFEGQSFEPDWYVSALTLFVGKPAK